MLYGANALFFILWHYYVSENATGEGYYINEKVFPKWKSKYPSPPDVIGVTRIYDPKVDRPVRGWFMLASDSMCMFTITVHKCIYPVCILYVYMYDANKTLSICMYVRMYFVSLELGCNIW